MDENEKTRFNSVNNVDNIPDDDTEDYIQPSQPHSFQGLSLESAVKKIRNLNDTTELSFSVLDDTIPVPETMMSTPLTDMSKDFIPSTELRPKLESIEERKKLNLDDTSLIQDTQDMFQSRVNETEEQVPESPSILESRNVSVIAESPSRINDTAESEVSVTDYIVSDRSERVLEETVDSVVLDLNDSSKSETSCGVNAVRCSGEDIVGSAPRLVDGSGLPGGESLRREVKKDSQIALDETIDANEVDFREHPYSSEKTDGEGVNANTVPSVTEELSSPIETPPADEGLKVVGEGLRLKSLLKKFSHEELTRLQKNSTPEDPLSHSMKINESTSSIERGTPPVEDEKSKLAELTCTMFLQVECHIVLDPVTQLPISKKIISVKELVRKTPKHVFLEPFSDSSSSKTKRLLSSSSSGSVYSDKTGLPYQLPGRPTAASVGAESSSSSSMDLDKHVQIMERPIWVNEYKIPMAMDEIMPRCIEHYLRETAKSDSSKRRSLIRSKKKSLWKRPLDNVLESSLTEPSSENNSDLNIHALNRNSELNRGELDSAGAGEGKSDCRDEKEAEVPNKMNEIDVGIDDGGNEPDGNDSADGFMAEGNQILARWTDKRYYPGTLKCREKYDRWEVQFDDGTEKVIREDLIMPLKWLTKGELIFVLVDGKYMSGKIVEILSCRSGELRFKVELDDSDDVVTIRKSDVCLNDVMAGIIQEKYKGSSKSAAMSKTASDIDFDNVLVGKRMRENRTPSRNATLTPQPGSSTIKKRKVSLKEPAKEEVTTPKSKPTPVPETEKPRSSGKKKSGKDAVAIDGEIGSPSGTSGTPTRGKSEGMKRRVRALNYESDNGSLSSKKSRLSEELETPSSSAKTNQKRAKGSNGDRKTKSGEASRIPKPEVSVRGSRTGVKLRGKAEPVRNSRKPTNQRRKKNP